MSQAAEVEAIRASREIVVVKRNPWTFEVESTDGTYKHELWWSNTLGDIVCATCKGRHGQLRCWARARCAEWLRAEMIRRRAESAA